MNLPDPQPLPQSSDPYWEFHQDNDEIPIVFVGDDAFPLSEHCMKPNGLKNASDMERVFVKMDSVFGVTDFDFFQQELC